MGENLKPCPFCNHTKEIRWQITTNVQKNSPLCEVFVYCDNCACRGPVVSGLDEDSALLQAMEKWDERHSGVLK